MKAAARAIGAAGVFLLMLLAAMAPGLVLVPQGMALPGSEVETAGGMSVSPSTLFTIENMVPGQQETEMLMISNGGRAALYSTITATMKSGDALLFEVLDLTICDGAKPLYGGKLKDLRGLELGTVPPGGQDHLTFRIGFPWECGNEYQNLKTKFIFEIAGTQHKSGGGNGHGGDTGTKPDPPEVLEPGLPDQPGAPDGPPEPGEPGEPGKPDEGLIVPQGDTPAGPGLPRTGQLPPWMWYGAGLALILAGAALNHRYRSGDR